MKQFFRSLLLSLLLTGAIGAAFRVFHQGTFFDAAVNRITMACLALLLAAVWYLFFSNLWFHHMQRKQRVLDALPQPEEAPQPEEPAKPQAKQPAEQWTAAPESAQRPAAKSSRSASSRSRAKTAEEKAAEKARKLQEAAQEKQARRARRLDEDAARQQQKLEELRAAAARKKAAGTKKRMDWKNSDSQNSEQ